MDAPPNVAEAEKIKSLRAAIGALPAWVDEPCLRRYLKARSWHVKQAEEMLRESIKWRAETQPEKITYEEVKPVLDLKTLYMNGHDKQGRPIIYVKPGAQNPFPADKRMRALLFILETAMATMPAGCEQLVWILDFSQYSFRGTTAESKQVSKQSTELLQNHYPERLAYSLVVSPPWFFSVLFAVVGPFMNSVTRSKIFVVGGSGEKLKMGLLEYVAENQLEQQYGGTNPNGYMPPPVVVAPAAAAAAAAVPAATAPEATTDSVPAAPAATPAAVEAAPASAAGAPAAAQPPAAEGHEDKKEKKQKKKKVDEEKKKSYLNMDVD